MPRKTTKSLIRKVNPDRKYNSVLVQRLINKTMVDGKKQSAERAVYQAMEIAAKKLKIDDPAVMFEKAIKNIYPSLEVKSRRVGGANYQIPFPVQGHRQQHLAFMWFVQAARTRKGMPIAERLAQEMIDATNQTGAAFKKKEDTHRMAEANRAFAHFARS
ncbi:MAG TPA: 30S ribosomal protein S7 [Candidatus Saccharimonas sp.]|nr:30S ribosomal protein S7 [Candidatus Saccharimonas sp.]